MTTTVERPAETTTATIASRVRDRAQTSADRVALREKEFGIWQQITWAEYWDTTRTVAHALLALGVDVGDRVAIHSENRPEWLYSDIAIVAIRAMTMGMYPPNPAPEVQYLLENSGSKILIAEDQEQIDKALEVADTLPDLERIVYIEPRGVRHYDDDRLLSWSDFLALGREHRESEPHAVERRMSEAQPDDIATLIYTSGTTGPPKGAMLSVANIEFAIGKLVDEGGFYDPPPTDEDVTLSYLPLCHVAERIATVWLNAAAGTLVHFAESIETVQQNLHEVQPTRFFAVPRIWEKIHAGVEIRMASAGRIKRANYRLWSRVAEHIGDALAANGGSHTTKTKLLYTLGYPFLFRALQDRIGLRKVVSAGSGAAPIVGQAAAQGYEGQYVGTSPTWNPGLIETPAFEALQAQYHQSRPWDTYEEGEGTGFDALREAFGEEGDDGLLLGWIGQYPLKSAIEKAIEGGDITRESIAETATTQESVDFEGMLPKDAGNFAAGEAYPRSTIIAEPDAETSTGVSSITDFITSDVAESFDFGGEPCWQQL